VKTRKMKGIEPIIAVVILIAITLVIAIGVIGWIMGWWGTLGAVESLQIYPDSYINVTDPPKLYLHLKNTGTATAVIYKIEIVGIETLTDTTDFDGTFDGTTITDGTVGPGVEGALTISLKANYVAGTNYRVIIYTKAGNVYSVTVQAKS